MANSIRLQMIQAIITRLAGNSGTLKGFAVPVVTALLGVSINKNNAGYAWLGMYPLVVFGLLDAYYLALEKRYRDLYNQAVNHDGSEWSLSAGSVTFADVAGALKSPSVWGFYLATLIAVVIVALTI